MDAAVVGSGYADHLTDADLGVLAAVTQGVPASGRATAAAWLRGHPEHLPGLIGDPRVFTAVFGPGDSRAGLGPSGSGPWGSGGVPRESTVPGSRVSPRASTDIQAALASPFLIFAVAVHRAAAELESMDHVPERSGPRQRVPLFDAPDLRDFLGSPARRLFLAELLASFTRAAGGQYPASPRGDNPPSTPRRGASSASSAVVRGRPRARRFSELDLARMAATLDTVPEADRPGAYRRLGDVALFLTGVFPDYAVAHALGPVSAARLLRAAEVPLRQLDQLTTAPAIDLFEYLGARWYRVAWNLAPARTGRLAVVAEVADRFRQARRVLNHIADRCLFPAGNPWFAPPAP